MRCILSVFVAAVLAAGCTAEAVKTEEPVRPVRTVTVSGKANPEMVSYPGRVKASKEASLAFRVPGQLEELGVKEGDRVLKGRLIAKLDQRDFIAAVGDLEARLAGARSVLNEARLNFERNQQLIESQTISQSDLDTAQSKFESSRANVRSLEQELRRARLNLQYTRLEAPFDGMIAVKHVENHEYVQAKEAIVQLEDISALDVVLDVPESVWARAFTGNATDLRDVSAKFEPFPGRSFPLKLKEFQTKANPQTQTYQVTLVMDRPERLSIHPGMTAEVTGRMPEHAGTAGVSIPVAAVFGPPDGEKYVWVFKDGIVSKRTVETGRIMNDLFRVRAGLEPGEIVVTCGVNYLHEGQRVKLLEGRIGERG